MLSSFGASLCLLLAMVVARASFTGAIVITEPSSPTFWSNATGAVNTMVWSLLPATYPPPKTQYFDIYLRNAAPGMYSPGINISLATRIDSQMGTSINLTDISRFRAGGGYQLFLSDPTDASIVYCGSDVFAVVSPTLLSSPVSSDTSRSSALVPSLSTAESTAPPSPTSAVSSSPPASHSTTIVSASETQASSTRASSTSQQQLQNSSATSGAASIVSTTETITTTIVLTQSTTVTRSSAFHSSRRPPHSIMPAIAPGSPQDQGFNLTGAAAARTTFPRLSLALTLLSAVSALLFL
ncbi:hypothetical protein BMF94_2894 [Rhodotorula taiwanensis]|uniref:Uncharacterized protein n=1 Tax=Rhodotorula taiwanensis TaxID=741276 RepID=A0A2S5BBC1_9BASI|nr:hypothetical protein BMF94_2894 [Rhodotorula taiwanensis]